MSVFLASHWNGRKLNRLNHENSTAYNFIDRQLEAVANNKIIHDVQDYHTGTGEVASLAERARVKKLVLNHLAPAPDNAVIKNMYLKNMYLASCN